ncbi:MAG: hypothetical protein HYY37_06435 [Candidatus Aenigmarchaeota archaeon]|nr:hypothetical protein [Candidatus Aenigmarchaeota archaeon]
MKKAFALMVVALVLFHFFFSGEALFRRFEPQGRTAFPSIDIRTSPVFQPIQTRTGNYHMHGFFRGMF